MKASTAALCLAGGAALAALTAPWALPAAGALLGGRGLASAAAFGSGNVGGWWAALLGGDAPEGTPPALAALAGAWALALLAGAALRQARSDPEREQEHGAFGSQRSERRRREILRRCLSWGGGVPGQPGFVAGFLKRRFVLTPATHAVFVAPSGSGKTRASVVPTAACAALWGKGSLVVTDPSMELWCYLRPMLERKGYRTLLVDLGNPYRGDRANLLAPITRLYREGLPHLAEERASEVGSLLFPETGGEQDSFTVPAGGLVSAVAYAVATVDGVDDADRTLVSVVATILEGTFEGGAGPLKEWLRGFGADSPVVGLSAAFLAAEGKYESSILGVLHAGLRPVATSAMRYLVSGGEVDLNALLREPTALFLRTCRPGAPANRLASVILAQLWAATERAGQRRGSVRPVWYLLDEAASLPPFGLPTVMQQGRKYGVRVGLWLQSLSGLDQHRTPKEDGKDAILANCDAKVLFRAGSEQDARYFEELGGKGTFLSKSAGRTKSSRDEGSSSSFSERERPVWMAGDLLQRNPAKDGVLLFQNPTGHPEMMGKFEVPVRNMEEVPFLAEELGTVGSGEFEEGVIAAELDRLDCLARKRMASAAPGAWTPEFGDAPSGEGGEPPAEELLGF